MARKREYRNPRVITAILEGETKDEIDQFRGRLSYGKVITLLWKLHKGEIEEVLENENLKARLEEKDRRIEELEKLVQKFQDQFERMGGLSSREREARDLRVEIRKILAKYHELKLLELFRRLGYSETGEALMRKAKVFVKRWFVLEGGVFVSKELGVVLEPRSDVGMLGWRVRLSNSVDGSFAAKAEVKADV